MEALQLLCIPVSRQNGFGHFQKQASKAFTLVKPVFIFYSFIRLYRSKAEGLVDTRSYSLLKDVI